MLSSSYSTYCLGFFQIDDAQDEDVITYLFDAPTPEGIFCLNVDKADEKCDKAVKAVHVRGAVLKLLVLRLFVILGFYCGTTEVVPGVSKTEQRMQVTVKTQ